MSGTSSHLNAIRQGSEDRFAAVDLAAEAVTLATKSASAPPIARVQILSDLHHDVRPALPPTLAPGADVVVVAGDTCEGPRKAFDYLRRFIPQPMPIVMVAGNHEHYRQFYAETLDEAREHAPAYGISFLENDAVEIAGIRFLGCTLWSDYLLNGSQRQLSSMMLARRSMNDHRLIGWAKRPWQRFRPDEALAMHQASLAFLTEALAQPYVGPTVVVSHHAPHPRSVHPRYEGDPLNAAYVSDLTALIETGRPALWVHGHVHSSFDYRVGATRVICNPHGYGTENPAFDPQHVVEVAR